MATLAIIFAMGSVWAQNGLAPKAKKTPEQRSEMFTKRMTKALTLDANQQERIRVINLERFKQIEEARASSSGAKGEVAAKVKNLNDNYLATLKGLLSEEQFQKFDEMKHELMDKAMSKKKGK